MMKIKLKYFEKNLIFLKLGPNLSKPFPAEHLKGSPFLKWKSFNKKEKKSPLLIILWESFETYGIPFFLRNSKILIRLNDFIF